MPDNSHVGVSRSLGSTVYTSHGSILVGGVDAGGCYQYLQLCLMMTMLATWRWPLNTDLKPFCHSSELPLESTLDPET